MITEEMETTITTYQGAPYVQVWTAMRAHITILDKNPHVECLDRGKYEGSVWAKYRVPAEKWNPVSGIKRQVNLSDEQKEQRRERMLALRNNQLKEPRTLDRNGPRKPTALRAVEGGTQRMPYLGRDGRLQVPPVTHVVAVTEAEANPCESD